MLALPLLTTLALAADPLDAVDSRARDLLARDPRGLGVGVILGAPTGVTVAYRAEGPTSLDGALAWSFDRPGLSAHADIRYDVSHQTTPDIPDTHFLLTLGAGPRVRIGDPPGDGSDADFDAGLRFPVTLGFYHEGFPLEGFLEVAPGLQILPSSTFVLDGAVGLRFYVPPPWKASTT
jgi:hypothetical protein